MQIDVQSKSKSLLGVTDLTLAATIKPGLIPALDSRSYESRLRLLLRTLNTLRVSSLEAEPTPLIADAVDRIRAIHSFRLAIVGEEPPRRLLLSVAFDGGWEPYMRRIWRDLGPLLDVIFCNCEGYLDAHSHNYPAYAGWVRSAQVETQFFYNASSLTVNDLHYLRDRVATDLRQLNNEQQCIGTVAGQEADRAETFKQAVSAVTALYRLVDMHLPLASATAGDFLLRAARHLLKDPARSLIEKAREKRLEATERAALTWFDNYEASFLKQALPAMTALYRLADMYPPLAGTNDGGFLLRAARHLLGDPAHSCIAEAQQEELNPTQRAALSWFANCKYKALDDRVPAKPEWDPLKVQGGIIETYKGATHACLLLVELKNAAAARDMLEYLEPAIKRTSATARKEATEEPFVNIGFTFQGLTLAGMPSGTFNLLPYEFREGMVARASILGDVRCNHPINWSLPERNWPPEPPQEERGRVELSSVHAIVQYTCKGPSDGWQEFTSDKHPLRKAIAQFNEKLVNKGVRILSVQSMRRFLDPVSGLPRGHFDFVDGISQPKLEASQHKSAYSDEVVLGDLLLGYENSHGDPPLTGRLWDDSTFLVVRKLKQDVKALNAVLAESGDVKDTKTKFMGRTGDGEVSIGDKMITGNDFDYLKDAEGKGCPFQAHIRRANPRGTRDDIRTVPRIMRRGMSYGPPFDEKNPDAEERGLFFMAYNASIAEQFEVIQAWLSGGNSSDQHTYSVLRDPFLGVPHDSDPHSFVFYDKNGEEKVVELPPDKPIVKLEWGLYAFVPSIKAIDELKELAKAAASIESVEDKDDPKKKDRRDEKLAMRVQKGAVIIAKLRQAEQLFGFESVADQWKIALEDITARMFGISEAVWAAIRELHGGALRTPYGVLVCSKKLVNEVFHNNGGGKPRYTVTGYAERMRTSFGEIYLGKDDDELPTSKYRAEACPANKAIMSVSREAAFKSSFHHTQEALISLVPGDRGRRLQVKDIVDDVLARIGNEWFGVPDGTHVVRGGWHWDRKPDDPPTCPGHFHSPSRYIFQPNPGPEATLFGQQHGKALSAAVGQLLEAQRKAERKLGIQRKAERKLGILGNALFNAYSKDQAQLTSTLIGVMMGFLPTVDGNIRGTLYEWVNNRSLWDHQLAYLADETKDRLEKACKVLMRPLKKTLLLRPVPELVWRTALERHSLGHVEVHPGDRIVVSIVSATQECLIDDDDDDGLYFIFGGNRSEKGRPTHACPGYKMAMGVMLGMLAGLLESTRLRPTLSPMELDVSLREGLCEGLREGD
ncbi:Dyp-type peroxidase family [Bradyrhizobium sp. AZCC 1719]|uniref:Dyp-type peroxidase n=1 Tax=Bradyrhizobium sp. AZCC 1719 TaxID=3117028 RepID=UPI002FF23FF8